MLLSGFKELAEGLILWWKELLRGFFVEVEVVDVVTIAHRTCMLGMRALNENIMLVLEYYRLRQRRSTFDRIANL